MSPKNFNRIEKQTAPLFSEEVKLQVEKSVHIEFDGGTPCNIPKLGFGLGYGSYKINEMPIVRVKFDRPMSNNQAEAETLAVALQKAHLLYGACCVSIGGDSQIALKWAKRLHGQHSELQQKKKNPWRTEFLESLRTLQRAVRLHSNITTEWRSRDASVTLFGH